MHIRHLEVTRAQLMLTDKIPFIFSRGHGQVADNFELIRLAHGISPEEFRSRPYTYTIINTNSPLQLDIPMADGIIDFAAAGQVLIITPFTLAGAMAPVTIAGALTLAHAEFLAGLTLAQIVKPGAPIVYGSFTSNVDMKSGSPAFGTPEYVKAAFGAGQLARFLGLPWRSSNATASNIPDAQSAYESQMSLWGALFGGCNFILHAAGWLESGLTTSYEKFILDIEMLQMFAEVFQPVGAAPPIWRSRRSPRWERADISSAARTPWSDTEARSMRPWFPTGAMPAVGRGRRQNGDRARERHLAE